MAARTSLHLRVLPLLAGLALNGCLPVEPIKYGDLRVQVVDQHGEPVRDARVEPVGGWYWGSARGVKWTDLDGNVEFSLPPTTYTVYANPPEGYRHRDPPYWSTTARIDVREGNEIFLEMQVVRERYPSIVEKPKGTTHQRPSPSGRLPG